MAPSAGGRLLLLLVLAAPPPLAAEPITVHVIAHSHDDLGWDETLASYFNGTVRKILAGVTQSLGRDPARKFSYAEMAFFAHWWDEQDTANRALVADLVRSGQLHFVGGGWCQHDEATTNWRDMIDQTTLGHTWIAEVFGEWAVPTVSWQLDPYGHSATHAALSAAMGQDFLVFARADRRDYSSRLAGGQGGLEFEWTPARSDPSVRMRTHMLWNLVYSWPSARTSTTAYDLRKFVLDAEERSAAYGSKHVLATFGDDFAYSDSEWEFVQTGYLMQRLAELPLYGVRMRWSSPAEYQEAVRQERNNSGAVKGPDDFFPYCDKGAGTEWVHSFWTGFYTSRPVLKRVVRTRGALLSAAWRATARRPGAAAAASRLAPLWKAVSVAQHHDAITGTARTPVRQDYIEMLGSASGAARGALSDSLGAERGLPPGALRVCDDLAEPAAAGRCLYSAPDWGQWGTELTVFNPAAAVRDEPVTIELPPQLRSGRGVCVRRAGSAALIRAQQSAEGLLSFIASGLPALASAVYSLSSGSDCPAAPVAAPRQQPPGVPFNISGAGATLSFDSSGRLAACAVAGGPVINCSLAVGYYLPRVATPSSVGSGAYISRQDAPDAAPPSPQRFPGDTGFPTPFVVRGPAYEEVYWEVDSQSGVSQALRLWQLPASAGAAAAELRTDVGPLRFEPFANGREVFVQFNTSIKSGARWRTDSNGLEFVDRERDKRSYPFPACDACSPKTLEANPQPVYGNYAPVQGALAINDSSALAALLPDRAQGGGSLHSGSMELMVHRRVMADDWCGLGEALNDTDRVHLTHRIVLGSKDAAAAALRNAQMHGEEPVQLLLRPLDAPPPEEPREARQVQAELPPNVRLATLQPLSSDLPGAPYPGAPPPRRTQLRGGRRRPGAPSPGSVLLRLLHAYGAGEHPTLSRPATVRVSDLFPGRQVRAAEYSLNAVRPLNQTLPADLTVTLNPMQLRTFVVQLL